jgi:hypothetical protein
VPLQPTYLGIKRFWDTSNPGRGAPWHPLSLPLVFHENDGCVKSLKPVIDGRSKCQYIDVTSVMRVRPKQRRNKSPDGPHGLFGFFVCLR